MKIGVLLLGSLLLCACKKQPGNSPLPTPEPVPATGFVKGADISWVTEMEAAGKKFYNRSGTAQDLFALMKSMGLNTIRLRVWVNPANGWNNKADVVAKAQRAKAAGLRTLINFHYSDSWADPGKQPKPAAWAAFSVTELTTALAAHTTDVLTALKTAGIAPEWVQVGNETNDGLLWPEGRASTGMANYARFINAGYEAVKAVFPAAKVIVHLSNGWDNALFRWSFDGLKAAGGKWDVIGLSLYPSADNWQYMTTLCAANMADMVQRYGKEVMVVEVGMPWDQETVSHDFLKDILSKTSAVPGGKGLGVLYWEPQAYANWQGYTLGAFQQNGRPTIALDAFK